MALVEIIDIVILVLLDGLFLGVEILVQKIEADLIKVEENCEVQIVLPMERIDCISVQEIMA